MLDGYNFKTVKDYYQSELHLHCSDNAFPNSSLLLTSVCVSRADVSIQSHTLAV